LSPQTLKVHAEPAPVDVFVFKRDYRKNRVKVYGSRD
jgi:hypothetical protein